MNWMKRSGAAGAVIMLAFLLTVFQSIPSVMSAGLAEEVPYRENEWNYVDISMDITNGIPENAMGRLAKIRNAGVLTVATEPYYPPQEFIDETQTGQARFVGSDMELARLIAERMDVELEIVPLEFAEVLSAVADGKYDLAISALSFTSGRASVLEMSKGYYYTEEKAPAGLIVRTEDAEVIRSVEDLVTLDIVAQSGSLQETMAAENILYYHKFRRLSTVSEVYDAVMKGEASAGVIDIENARTFIENHPDCALSVVPDIFFALQPPYEGNRIAAAKGEIELICFVNGVIDEVLESGLYKSWFDQYADTAAQN